VIYEVDGSVLPAAVSPRWCHRTRALAAAGERGSTRRDFHLPSPASPADLFGAADPRRTNHLAYTNERSAMAPNRQHVRRVGRSAW